MHDSEKLETMMDENTQNSLEIEFSIHFRNGSHGCKRLRNGQAPAPSPVIPGSIPRISRLMALAIHFERLLQKGEILEYADLARVGQVSRPRITQIMSFLQLAPNIQEEILYLPHTVEGADPIAERDIRPILAEVDWWRQRSLWKALKR